MGNIRYKEDTPVGEISPLAIWYAKYNANVYGGGGPRRDKNYNTILTPEQEAKYREWVKTLPANLQSDYDYDLRGAWLVGDVPDENGHMTDYWKKPWHPTFSVESRYSSTETPGGEWHGEEFAPSWYNNVLDGYRRYWAGNEFDKGGPKKTFSAEQLAAVLKAQRDAELAGFNPMSSAYNGPTVTPASTTAKAVPYTQTQTGVKATASVAEGKKAVQTAAEVEAKMHGYNSAAEYKAAKQAAEKIDEEYPTIRAASETPATPMNALQYNMSKYGYSTVNPLMTFSNYDFDRDRLALDWSKQQQAQNWENKYNRNYGIENVVLPLAELSPAFPYIEGAKAFKSASEGNWGETAFHGGMAMLPVAFKGVGKAIQYVDRNLPYWEYARLLNRNIRNSTTNTGLIKANPSYLADEKAWIRTTEPFTFTGIPDEATTTWQDIRYGTALTPSGFHRFKYGDLELNDPSIAYRQIDAGAGNDFLKTGVVVTEGKYSNPLFKQGTLWYGVPYEGHSITRMNLNALDGSTPTIRSAKQADPVGSKTQTPAGVSQKAALSDSPPSLPPLPASPFNIEKLNDFVKNNTRFTLFRDVSNPVSDVLVSKLEMVPANQSANKLNWISSPKTRANNQIYDQETKKYYDRTDTEVSTERRRIPYPKGSANSSNTSLYRYEPGYGYVKYDPNPPAIVRPFETGLVDDNGNLTKSVGEVIDDIRRKFFYASDPREIVNKGFAGRERTSLSKHIEDVVKSAKEFPLPEGVSRKEFVTAALYHDLGKLFGGYGHGLTSSWVVDRMGLEMSPAVRNAVKIHMMPQESFNDADALSKALHAADVARGASYETLLSKFPYLRYASGGSIHINPANRGKFKAAANRAGKSVQAYASQILAHKGNYSPTLVKRANFARNAAKWHADGGQLYDLTPLEQYYINNAGKIYGLGCKIKK